MSDYKLPRPLAAAIEDPTRTPEQKLVAAVLHRALVDTKPEIVFNRSYTTPRHDRIAFYKSKRRKDVGNIYANLHMIQSEALRWFRSGDREKFSFLWCCEQLGLCPSIFRRAVG